MGIDKREKANRTDTGRLARVGRNTGLKATFAGTEAGLLLAVVHWMSESGAAVRLGKTSDGGALAIGLYDGSEKRTEYLRPADSVNEFLLELLAAYAPTDVIAEWEDWLEALKQQR